MHPRLHETLAVDGLLSRRRHPDLIGRIDAAVKRGELIALLPGTYAPSSCFETLLLSIADWDPNAVFTGVTAAQLTWWPELTGTTVCAATSRRLRRAVPHTQMSQFAMPPDLVIELNGLRVQTPAASALDIARERGPAALDEAFRRGAANLSTLWHAYELMSWRPGNKRLLALLRASRDAPWSALEREAHERLRAARITNWKTNYTIWARGRRYYADIAFPGSKLDVELDGWRYHSDRNSFSNDRARDVDLQLAGWRVLHFTSATIDQMVPAVREALADRH